MNDTLPAPSEIGNTVAGKYLTFTINNESFGIDVLKVREIIRMISITAVPQMPHHVRGVINLRGRIIPVIDLRLRFGFQKAENSDHTCIVVVHVKSMASKHTLMGIVVDGVEEVINIGEADIEETPEFGCGVSVENIIGMAKVKGAVKALLNIDRVIGSEDIPQSL